MTEKSAIVTTQNASRFLEWLINLPEIRAHGTDQWSTTVRITPVIGYTADARPGSLEPKVWDGVAGVLRNAYDGSVWTGRGVRVITDDDGDVSGCLLYERGGVICIGVKENGLSTTQSLSYVCRKVVEQTGKPVTRVNFYYGGRCMVQSYGGHTNSDAIGEIPPGSLSGESRPGILVFKSTYKRKIQHDASPGYAVPCLIRLNTINLNCRSRGHIWKGTVQE